MERCTDQIIFRFPTLASSLVLLLRKGCSGAEDLLILVLLQESAPTIFPMVGMSKCKESHLPFTSVDKKDWLAPVLLGTELGIAISAVMLPVLTSHL